MEVKVIEWHKRDEEVLAAKEAVAEKGEAEVVKEGAGQGDGKDAEIKSLKNRVTELELLLQLNKSNKLIEPEFILCDKLEEDDPESYAGLVCSGLRGDLNFESPSKEEKKMEEDKLEKKNTRSIIIRLKAKLDSNYEYYYLKRKAENVEEKEKKKKRKKKKGVEEKEEDVVVEKEKEDGGKDIQEEIVREREEKEEDV